MLRIKIASLLLVTATFAPAQKTDRPGTTFVSNSMGFANGVTAKATIAAEPPAPLSVFETMMFSISTSNGDTYHRWIVDDSQRGYFGYDISTERIPNGDRIRVTFVPLTLPPDQLNLPPGQASADQEAKKLAAYRFLVLPRYPAPIIVGNGDTIALDLLVSADGKQKIVDYIEISYKTPSNPKR
jgi:hypothetical protein